MSRHCILEPLESRLLFSAAVETQVLTAAPMTQASLAPVTVSQSSRASAKASVKFLAQVMDQYHNRFPIYDDVSSAGNHFNEWAKIPDQNANVEMNGSWPIGPHSGATAIRASFTPASSNEFGGFYMMNGVLPDGATSPSVNFGDVPNSGIDLSGAKSLSFWVRGQNGGEKIEFFVGGVGRDAATGAPVNAFPDSSPRHPNVGVVTRLTTKWRKVRIDLKSADLSYVLGGFAWVASAKNNPAGATFFLDDIQFELKPAARQRRLNQPRFLVSYQMLPGTNDGIDLALRNTAFSYDNALALLAFLANGSRDSIRRAGLIGDAFVYATAHDRSFSDGRVRSDYAGGDIALPPGWTPHNLVGTTPIPGYYAEDQHRFFEVEQTATDTGNNAWVMIALLALYKKTGQAVYLDTASRIGTFIVGFRNDSGTYGGFLGGIDNPESDHPTLRQYVSVEHNEDINAAFTVMAQITGESAWADEALHARQFVESMWDQTIGLYRPGTRNPNEINTDFNQVPLDVQAWSILSNAAILNLHPDLLATVQASHGITADGFTGFDFNTDRDGVWFEGTGQMAVSEAVAGQSASVKILRDQLRRAQAHPPTGNRLGIAAASHDGVTTGFGFNYFRRLHIAATAWNVFAQLGFDPYYSGEPAPMLSVTT